MTQELDQRALAYGRTVTEQLVDMQQFETQPPAQHMSAIRAILALTNARYMSEIGENGPSCAATASEANKGRRELNLFSNDLYPRDAHVVAEILYKFYPKLTDATILACLKDTGVRENLRTPFGPQDEEEYGKVPHEIRDANDPRNAEGASLKDRAYPYYGAVDTTGKNVRAIARRSLQDIPDSLAFLDTQYEARDGNIHTVEDGLQAHVDWLRKRMDMNKDGLIESLWINKKHHANQSWADSPDSFHHQDGSWAQHHPDENWGVSAVEVQAETYDALLDTVELYEKLAAQSEGSREVYLRQEIHDLTQRAGKLRAVVMKEFWVDDAQHNGGYFARGTDRDQQGNLRPLSIRSSDMGHLLNSRLLDGDDDETRTKREAVIRNLFSPEMLCPNGIRTLSTDSVRYREDAYHNGSSWPWTSYDIAKGLERHGYYGLADDLKQRVWSFYDTTKMLAEYGTGSADPNKRINTEIEATVFDPSLFKESIQHFSRHKIVQPPQEMQAWTVAAILAIKKEYGVRLFHPENAIPTRAIDDSKLTLEDELQALIEQMELTV